MSSISEMLMSQVIGYAVAIIIIGLVVYMLYKSVFGSGFFSSLIPDIGSIGKNIGEAVGKVAESIGTPLECANDETNRAGLCYKNCPDGYEDSDGTQRCYTPVPEGWTGNHTVAHLQHDTIYSTVGADSSKSIPNGCGDGKQMYAGLCYEVPSGWKVTSPGFIGETCENLYGVDTFGGRDDGTACWIDSDNFGRGTGYSWEWSDGFKNDGMISRCEKEWGGGNCEMWGAIAYPKCNIAAKREGKQGDYGASGCCTCHRAPQRKGRGIKSRIGSLPDKCPDNRELVGRLCYPNCSDEAASRGKNWSGGYERRGDNLEFCSTKCPSDHKNIGIGGCERPYVDVGTGIPVHVCPNGKINKGSLCYNP
jgi:hypothetical protein